MTGTFKYIKEHWHTPCSVSVVSTLSPAPHILLATKIDIHTISQNMLSRQSASVGAKTNPSKILSLTFIRNKRTAGASGLPPHMQRAVTQLSVMSARKKVPKMLKLSKEDLIKHQTIQRAWAVYQEGIREARERKLEAQYNSIDDAMNKLRMVSPKLFELADVDESGKLFPMELRVPTDYPPTTIWYNDYKKPE